MVLRLRPAAVPLLVGLALALVSCGQSGAEQARADVCDARDDIAGRIDSLQGLTLATATTDQIRTDLDAIGNDLQKIADSRDELEGDLKQQVQQANQTFRASLDSALADVGQSRSLGAAAAGIENAIAGLASSYRAALAPIDCG